MEARSRGEEGHLFAPGSYVVGMHGDDYERLEPHRSYLEREWSELLREMGARVGIRYEGEPRVSMVPKDGVPRGAVEVSVAGDPGAPAERFEPRAPPSGDTTCGCSRASPPRTSIRFAPARR